MIWHSIDWEGLLTPDAEGGSCVRAGVLDLKQAQEWVVTTKLGSSDKRPGTAATQPSPVLRFYASEMMMSLFVLTAALYGIFSVNKWSFSIFLTLQGGGPLSSPLLIPNQLLIQPSQATAHRESPPLAVS